MHRCQICGLVPRQFWVFGGTPFWYYVLDDRLCPCCAQWAGRLLR